MHMFSCIALLFCFLLDLFTIDGVFPAEINRRQDRRSNKVWVAFQCVFKYNTF